MQVVRKVYREISYSLLRQGDRGEKKIDRKEKLQKILAKRQKRINVHSIRREATEPKGAITNKRWEQESPSLEKSAPKWQKC